MSELQQSEQIGELAGALAKAQGAFASAKKDSVNPFFRSKYADLASVFDACRGPLSSNGLAVIQRVSTTADTVIVTTTLLHSSGQWLYATCGFPVAPIQAKEAKEAAKITAQAVGSAITYGRRYTLSAMLGIASEEDDDGNAATILHESKPVVYTPREPVREQASDIEAPPHPAHAQPKPADAVFRVPFGKSKGQPITAVSDNDVQFLANYFEKAVSDPAKKNFRQSNEAALIAVNEEIAARANRENAEN